MLRVLIFILLCMTASASQALERITYFVNDISGSPVVEIDGLGNVVASREFRHYGEVHQSHRNSGREGTIGYAGAIVSGDNLLSVGVRFYAPEIGRFLSPDPVTFRDNGVRHFGRYHYAYNNPYRYADPSGELPVVPLIMGAIWLADKAYAAYEVYQDASAISNGSKTLGEVVVDRAAGDIGGMVLGPAGRILGSQIKKIAPDLPKKGDTLKPGPFAKESIPARGPERDFTRTERDQINDIGRRNGCHTCGTKDPGTKSGDFIPDHQTPSKLNTNNDPQVLLPQCKTCSARQGGEVRQATR